jgi:branched-chain amino acid transport system ATP-binding protein
MSTPLLHASGITKRFGALTVLQDVNLTLQAGEAVGVVGPNGAGKTTLMSVLTGAHPPSAGAVHFRGDDVSRMAAAERCRRGIVRTHQVPRPFGGMTVFENAYVAASLAADAQGGTLGQQDAFALATDALRLCGMLDLANRRADSLGLLDRKRLELARAVSTSPRLLLLDEIGGGLTDGEADVLVEIIRELRRRQITIVWIEHIVHVLVQVAERLICMDAGRIIADGEPRAVMAHPEVVSAYLGGMPA